MPLSNPFANYYGYQRPRSARSMASDGLAGYYSNLAAPIPLNEKAGSYFYPGAGLKTGIDKPAGLAAYQASEDLRAAAEAGGKRGIGRRDTVLAGYDQQIGNARGVSDALYSLYGGFGNAQRQQLLRRREQQLAQAGQSARRRGLGNTTILDSLNRGVESAYDQGSLDLEDRLAMGRIGLGSQALDRENQLTGGRLRFLESYTDQYPTLSDIQGRLLDAYALQATT